MMTLIGREIEETLHLAILDHLVTTLQEVV